MSVRVVRGISLRDVVAALVLIGALALGAGLPARLAAQDFVEVADGAYRLAEPEPVADFRLTDHRGKVFDRASLRDRWSFLFFGYTHCPDLCPTTLAVFAAVQRRLLERGDAMDATQFVFVTVDPGRDTPEVLAAYLPHFGGDLVGASGEPAELARLAGPLGVVHGRSGPASGDAYLVDHSSAALLIDPHGRLHGIFAAPHEVAVMLQGFDAIRAGETAPATSAASAAAH